MPSKVPDGETRGWIVPIGGAEDKIHDPRILHRFVELCGGADADIVVIPTATSAPTPAPATSAVPRARRRPGRSSMDFDTRARRQEPSRLAALEQATGIFLTGGNQLRLSTILGGTPVAKLIRERNAARRARRRHLGRRRILCEHMIAFGDEGATPRAGSVRLAPGLGLTNRFIIDQHFRQRDRLGRLLTALAYNPFAVGIGLDEDTAAFIGPTTCSRSRAPAASPWSTPAALTFPRWTASRRASRCACWG